MIFFDNDKPMPSKFTIDATVDPPTIDVIDARINPEKRGIYELKGDTLRMCFNELADNRAARPKRFASEAGQPHNLLFTMKRRATAKLREGMKQLQGTWKVISALSGGKEMPAGRRDNVQFVIAGNLLLILEPNGEIEVLSYNVDPSTMPPAIDLVEDGRPGLGIYELKGDELRICFNDKREENKRPTKFISEEGKPFQRLLVLKRASAPNEDRQAN